MVRECIERSGGRDDSGRNDEDLGKEDLEADKLSTNTTPYNSAQIGETCQRLEGGEEVQSDTYCDSHYVGCGNWQAGERYLRKHKRMIHISSG